MVLYLKQTVEGKTFMSETDEHLTCLRCGRKLRSAEAKMRGYGPICFERMLSNKQSQLFQLNREVQNAKK